MKKRLIVALLFLLVAALSCESDGPARKETSPELTTGLAEGVYTGSFIRSSPLEKYAPAQVSLVLENNRFKGSSSVEKYPAICEGSYRLAGTEITFTNECFWTAEFDWTFILSDTYQISREGAEIILTRSMGSTTDMYRLKKQ